MTHWFHNMFSQSWRRPLLLGYSILNVKALVGASLCNRWIICSTDQDIVQYLHEQGGDIHTCNRRGWTPLMFAVNRGHLEMVQWLVDRGADINICDHRGWTPLMVAASQGHLDIVLCLFEKVVFNSNNYTMIICQY